MSSIVGDVGPAEAERLIIAYSERYMQVVALEVLRNTVEGETYDLPSIRDALSRPSGQWLCSLIALNPAFHRVGRNRYMRLSLADKKVEVKKNARKEERAACRACLEFLSQL